MKCQLQEFAPKDLDRIIDTAATAPDVHPNLGDLADMAEDTINGAGLDFTPSRDQVEGARRTIAEILPILAHAAAGAREKP
jgi:hypothetical protein